MKRIICNIVTVAMMAGFCFFLVSGNVFRISVPVATVEGSYADQYAKKHRLQRINTPDSLDVVSDLRYETFEYNVEGSGLSIEAYKGIGTEVVVPSEINQWPVYSIGEDFFKKSATIKSLYLPRSIETIDAKSVDNVVLYMSEDSFLPDELAKEGWNVENYSDSEAPFFSLGNIPFEYSKKEKGINLVAYTGDDSIVSIPSHIDGIPVTEVSFNMVGYELVVFPETVTAITGNTGVTIYSRVFLVGLIFTIIAFVLALLVVNSKIGKFKSKEEYVLSGSQVILTFLYLAFQICFSLWAIYSGSISWLLAFIVSVVITGLFILFVFMGGAGRKHAMVVEEKFQEKTSSMNEIKNSVAHLTDGMSDKTVRRAVEHVVEEIRYSPSSSNDELRSIENSIKEEVSKLDSAIREGKASDILEQCETTMKLVKERNHRAKEHR